MSAFNEIEVECPECGEKFNATVWTSIHTKQDPELKDMLMGGELNIIFCTKCSHTFFYENFLLFQDPRLEILAYVYPPAEEERKDELEITMQRGFAEAQEAFDPKDRITYKPTLYFGLDQLQERIREDEVRVTAEEVARAKQAKS